MITKPRRGVIRNITITINNKTEAKEPPARTRGALSCRRGRYDWDPSFAVYLVRLLSNLRDNLCFRYTATADFVSTQHSSVLCRKTVLLSQESFIVDVCGQNQVESPHKDTCFTFQEDRSARFGGLCSMRILAAQRKCCVQQ